MLNPLAVILTVAFWIAAGKTAGAFADHLPPWQLFLVLIPVAIWLVWSVVTERRPGL